MDDTPQTIAQAFLAALDDGRWREAAALVDPHTREQFRTWSLQPLANARDEHMEPGDAETRFVSPAALLGRDAASLDDVEFLARFAEAVQPANVIRRLSGDSGQIRVTRTLLEVAPVAPVAPDHVTARYRTEWWHGPVRNEATAGVHSLELARTSAGWRVRDADLSGSGGGHILPPET